MMKRKRKGNQIILVNIRNEEIDKSRGVHCQRNGILVLVAGTPNLDTDELV